MVEARLGKGDWNDPHLFVSSSQQQSHLRYPYLLALPMVQSECEGVLRHPIARTQLGPELKVNRLVLLQTKFDGQIQSRRSTHVGTKQSPIDLSMIANVSRDSEEPLRWIEEWLVPIEGSKRMILGRRYGSIVGLHVAQSEN